VLSNPAICIQAGTVIWFTCNSRTKNFPVYLKDSVLNTNPLFDYGPFTDLQNMILNQNITVTQFSFPFNQKGNYIFEDYTSHKLTIVSVVGADQTCSNSVNGFGASMITQQSLSEIGIESQTKNIQTNWSWIGLAYFLLIIFIFGVIGVITLGQNLQSNTISLFGGKKKKVNTIYYDKINDENEEAESVWSLLCRRCLNRNKQDNKVE
jgi:hypothetical protein